MLTSLGMSCPTGNRLMPLARLAFIFWLCFPILGASGRDCTTTYCNSVGTLVSTQNADGSCTCTCRNQFQGAQCQECPFVFTGTECNQCANDRLGYPDCYLTNSPAPATTVSCSASSLVTLSALPLNCGDLGGIVRRTCRAVRCQCFGADYIPLLDSCEPDFEKVLQPPTDCESLKCFAAERECRGMLIQSLAQTSGGTSTPAMNTSCASDVSIQLGLDRATCKIASTCLGCNTVLLCGDNPMGINFAATSSATRTLPPLRLELLFVIVSSYLLLFVCTLL
jgi:hypothetical protein